MELDVSRLKVYDLEQLRFEGMPTAPPHKRVGYSYSLHRQHKNTARGTNKRVRSSASGVIIASEHTGTHLDALCHQAVDHRMHGDIPVTPAIETSTGFTKLGIETVAPLVARGVLLDISYFKGLNCLPEFYEISVADLRKCCKYESVSLRHGDVVLVRTGFGQFWLGDGEKYMKAAGLSLEASKWLSEKQPIAVGADNPGWEVVRLDMQNANSNLPLPSHVLLLVERGIHIIEDIYLEELSKDRCYEFLFISTPLKMKGATASPVRPIALIEV